MRALAALVDMSRAVPAERAAEHLERGDVLVFPPGLAPAPTAAEQDFLRTELPRALRLKNISYHVRGDYLTGLRATPDVAARTRMILRDWQAAVERALGACLPAYAAGWRAGKTNYRPVEERGRNLSRRSSNEYLHVDAFASGATHGDRILRFFTNLHRDSPRVWRTAGHLADLLSSHGPGPVRVTPTPLDRVWSALVQALSRPVPAAEMLDSSRYDRTMRRIHNRLKDDDAFQAEVASQGTLEFSPGTSWAVMTDVVSHAVTSGQHALVTTFHVRLRDCILPELAPYHLLSGGSHEANTPHGFSPTTRDASSGHHERPW